VAEAYWTDEGVVDIYGALALPTTNGVPSLLVYAVFSSTITMMWGGLDGAPLVV